MHKHYRVKKTLASGSVFESPFWTHDLDAVSNEVHEAETEGLSAEIIEGECGCAFPS